MMHESLLPLPAHRATKLVIPCAVPAKRGDRLKFRTGVSFSSLGKMMLLIASHVRLLFQASVNTCAPLLVLWCSRNGI